MPAAPTREKSRSSSGSSGWIAGAVAVLLACATPGPDETNAYDLAVAEVRDRGGVGVSPQRATAILSKALAQTDDLRLVQRDGLPVRLSYWELPRSESDGGRDLVVDLSVDAPAELREKVEGPRIEATVLLERKEGATAATTEEDLEVAMRRAAAVLQARIDLANEDEPAIRRLVLHSDPELAILALDHIAEFGGSDLSETVLRSLDHRDARVRYAAIEALGVVGGPSEVVPLLSRVKLADAGSASRTYEALASMGGAHAARFLRFAALNEDEPERRRVARLALEALETGTAPQGPRGGHPDRARGHRR